LFVDSSGNVGFGVSSPELPIHLPDGNVLLLGTTAATGTQIQHTASANFLINNKEAGAQIFYTSDTERMRLDSSGRLGLGTSSPSALAHLANTSSTAGYNFLQITAGGESQVHTVKSTLSTGRDLELNTARTLKITTGSNTGSFASEGHIQFSHGTNGDLVRIAADGKVGIGSTLVGNANNRLLVRSDSASAISNVLLLSNGPADNNAGQGVRINLSGVSEANSNIRYAYIEAATATTENGHYIAFGTNAAATTPVERARIDSSGRLLVGTSTSASQGCNLQIRSDTGVNAEFIRSANNSGGAYIALTKTRGTASSPTEVSSGDDLGTIDFIGYDGATYRSAAYIQAQADGTWTDGGDTTDNPGRLVFSTTADGASSPTERMRINNAGLTDLYSAAAETLNLRSGSAAGTTDYLLRGRYSATSTSSGTNSFNVFTNGNVTNTNNSYGAISDIKLKENIVDANSQWDDLKALQVRNYNFKEGQIHTQIGLVAQEVELVSPGLVGESIDLETGESIKSVNYSVLYMKAVKGLQEAMERIEQLETSNADLLARVTALEAQ
jgi:hypothetical protein